MDIVRRNSVLVSHRGRRVNQGKAMHDITAIIHDFRECNAFICNLFLCTDMRENPSSIPAIEVQCRVIKRWPHLSSLLVEVLPWCLLVNNIAVHVIIRDLERDVDIDLPSGSVVAPHRITV